MNTQRFEFTTEATLENLEPMVDFVATSAVKLGLPATETVHLEVAVDEACTNVIRHAYGGGSGPIWLTCEKDGNDIVVVVRDRGIPFDPQKVRPPDLDSPLEERRVGGLGIYLMHKLMDDVSYHFDPDQGNMLVLRKRLRARNSPLAE